MYDCMDPTGQSRLSGSHTAPPAGHCQTHVHLRTCSVHTQATHLGQHSQSGVVLPDLNQSEQCSSVNRGMCSAPGVAKTTSGGSITDYSLLVVCVRILPSCAHYACIVRVCGGG